MKKNFRCTLLHGCEFKIMRLNDAPAVDTVLDNPDRIADLRERLERGQVIFYPARISGRHLIRTTP